MSGMRYTDSPDDFSVALSSGGAELSTVRLHEPRLALARACF
jgi:hypothetical protein